MIALLQLVLLGLLGYLLGYQGNFFLCLSVHHGPLKMKKVSIDL